MKSTKPTIRQAKLAKLYAEAIQGEGEVRKGELIREAGYSKGMIDKGSKIMNTDGFILALNEIIPEDMVLKAHKDLLENAEDKTKLGAIKLAYELRGRTSQGKQGFGNMLTQFNINL